MILLELLVSFLIIGAAAFGGGYSVIPMIEHEIVTVHEWITPKELSELIAVAQMTPGAIGVNAATYTGFRVAGVAGAAAATVGFTLPSVLFCAAMIGLLSGLGAAPWADTLKKSVRPAVAGLIVAAVLTYGRASVTNAASAVLALAAFAVLMLFKDRVHPVLLILSGGIVGVVVF